MRRAGGAAGKESTRRRRELPLRPSRLATRTSVDCAQTMVRQFAGVQTVTTQMITGVRPIRPTACVSLRLALASTTRARSGRRILRSYAGEKDSILVNLSTWNFRQLPEKCLRLSAVEQTLPVRSAKTVQQHVGAATMREKHRRRRSNSRPSAAVEITFARSGQAMVEHSAGEATDSPATTPVTIRDRRPRRRSNSRQLAAVLHTPALFGRAER